MRKQLVITDIADRTALRLEQGDLTGSLTITMAHQGAFFASIPLTIDITEVESLVTWLRLWQQEQQIVQNFVSEGR